MPRRKIWEVNIDVVGPITIDRQISFKQEKGFDEDQFYSNITLKPEDYGVSSKLTAYADNMEMAQIAAFVFFGRMIDILTFDNLIPLSLHSNRKNSTRVYKDAYGTKRKFSVDEFMTAFKMARKLEVEHPRILKAIGWFAKGVNSDNALDCFLSYWNAIEIIGTTYYTPTERTSSGAINQIYQCFLELWGDEENWGLPMRWINDMHDERSKIAHGANDTTVEALNQIACMLPGVSDVTKKVIYSVLDKQYENNIWESCFLESQF